MCDNSEKICPCDLKDENGFRDCPYNALTNIDCYNHCGWSYDGIPPSDNEDCECENDRDDGDDFPLYLDYEGLYGNSEMDNCTEMGGGDW